MDNKTAQKHIEDWSKIDPQKPMNSRRANEPKEDPQARKDIESWAKTHK